MIIPYSLAFNMNGTVYLIHFEKKHFRAQHYLGWTVDLQQRLRQHKTGQGARLLKYITEHGIAWIVVRQWEGNWVLERRLKRRKKSRELCPKCIYESNNNSQHKQ